MKDLMKPRFKLIAIYPGCINLVGSIAIEESTASYFRQFPANFKELSWWEDRKPEDMPEYVKSDLGIGKVKEWHEKSASKVTIIVDAYMKSRYVLPEDCFETPLYSEIFPATEAEYFEYIKPTTNE